MQNVRVLSAPVSAQMFEAMPDVAWTIRVGEDPHSAARYLLHGPDAVRELLRALA